MAGLFDSPGRKTMPDLGLPEGVLRDILVPIIERIEARAEARAAQIAADLIASITPNVHVAGPTVNVPAQPAPTVTVEVPKINAEAFVPDVVVDVSVAELAVAQRTTNELLRQLIDLVRMPTTRIVSRDANGMISSVTERRDL